ncbi:unnamed protein product, partial [Iphiclides podalirius]
MLSLNSKRNVSFSIGALHGNVATSPAIIFRTVYQISEKQHLRHTARLELAKARIPRAEVRDGISLVRTYTGVVKFTIRRFALGKTLRCGGVAFANAAGRLSLSGDCATQLCRPRPPSPAMIAQVSHTELCHCRTCQRTFGSARLWLCVNNVQLRTCSARRSATERLHRTRTFCRSTGVACDYGIRTIQCGSEFRRPLQNP